MEQRNGLPLEDAELAEGLAINVNSYSVERSINGMDTGKAAGPSGIISEMMKIFNEEADVLFTRIVN